MGKSALEPKMIEQAREALRASIASGRLTVTLDDALHYLAARPQHSLDIVASGYVFHNLTANYRERLYDEIWRVLAPAGLLINADKYAQQGEAHREALDWQLGLFSDVLGSRAIRPLARMGAALCRGRGRRSDDARGRRDHETGAAWFCKRQDRLSQIHGCRARRAKVVTCPQGTFGSLQIGKLRSQVQPASRQDSLADNVCCWHLADAWKPSPAV